MLALAVGAKEFPYPAPHSTMWLRDFVQKTPIPPTRIAGRETGRETGRVTGLRIVTVVAAHVLAGAGLAGAAEEVSIATLIPFAEKAEIRETIREECGLGSKLSKALVKRGAKKEVTLVRVGNLEATGDAGRSLELRITDAIQTSGGFFPAHSITIDGVLKEEGRIVGTMEGTSLAAASFIPFRRGQCAILEEAIRLLAKDVIRWVKKPRLDARLGEAG